MTSSTISPVEVMKKTRVIAVVGASRNPAKEANSVPQFLKNHGYRIVPVNPTATGILDETTYPDLSSIPDEVAVDVDTVEVFRPSEELPEVARAVVAFSERHGKKYTFWSQLGLENDEAKKILDQAGLPYVMNSCMKVVYGFKVAT